MPGNMLADVFNSDIFSSISLTESINKLPKKHSMLGDMGIFKEDSITGTIAMIEESQGKLSLVQSQVRGTRGNEQTRTKRKARPFTVPHLPQYDSIRADELLGIREFGSADSLKTVAKLLNDRMQAMRDDMDITKEYQRCGAIQGLVKDADGSTLYDFFDEFGVTEEVHTFYFDDTPTVKFKTVCQEVYRDMQLSLGNTRFTGIKGICGDEFWDAMIVALEVEKVFLNWDSRMLQNLQTQGFRFGDIDWINYTGKIGTEDMIPADVCRFVPVGAGDTLKEVYAPANFVETVNTNGLPYYAKQERQPFDMGIDLHAQSNPLIMTTRPGCLHKGVLG